MGLTSVPGVWFPFDLVAIASISGMNSCPTFSTSAQLEDRGAGGSGGCGASYSFPSGFKTAPVLLHGVGISSYTLSSLFPRLG